MTCVVPKCNSRTSKKRKGVVFHGFPHNEARRKHWMKFCEQFNFTKVQPRDKICSLHFTKDDYYSKPQLKDGAVPSILNNTVFTINPAEVSGSRVSVKNMTDAEKKVYDLETKLEESKQELVKQCEYRKLIEKRLQIANRKLLQSQGGLPSDQRHKAIINRLKSSEDALHKLFTPQQIKFLSGGKRPQQWDFTTMLKGLRLRMVTSKRIYKFLRESENLPLPSFPSLTLWVRETFCVKPGITHSIKLLQIKANALPTDDRDVILVYGEMALNSLPCYDILDDQVYGPCNQLLVVMIQGLYTSWSQPVFFHFDRTLDKILLYKIINDIECTGLQVRAIVSEVSHKTSELWSSLNISSSGETSFTTSTGSERNIWVFCDSWQLMMSFRDNLLQNGMTVGDKFMFNSDHFFHLFKILQELQWKPCPKVTWDYIQVTGQGRGQVYLASRLFSSTIASALRNYMPSCTEAAAIIELTDQIFDILNTSNDQDDKAQRKPVCHLDETRQQTIKKFADFMFAARFDQPNLLLFQEGFIITLKSLLGLFIELDRKPGGTDKVFSTNKLTVNCVEDIFSRIRTQRSGCIHPNPVEAKSRIRDMVIEANKDAFINLAISDKMTTDPAFNEKVKKNIPEFIDELLQKPDPDDDFLLSDKITDEIDQIYTVLLQEVRTNLTIETTDDFCAQYSQMMNMNVNMEYNDQTTEIFIPTVQQHNASNNSLLAPNMLTSQVVYSSVPEIDSSNANLANVSISPTVVSNMGISSTMTSVDASTISMPCLAPTETATNSDPQLPPAKKQKKKVIEVSEQTWAKKVSKGTNKVNSKWADKFKMFENMFNEFHNCHPDHLSREPKVVDKLTKLLIRKEPKLDSRLLRRYVRLRTMIRLRYVFKKYTQDQITIHIPY